MRQLLNFFEELFSSLDYAIWQRFGGGGTGGRRSRSRLPGLLIGVGVLAVIAVGLFFAVQQLSSSSSSTSKQAAAPAETPVPGTATPDAAALTGGAVTVYETRDSHFAWPAVGDVLRYFGLYSPTGIEIGLPGGTDSPIRASNSGTVKFAGGDPCCGYGTYVVIDHADGFNTIYGHLASIQVAVGQQVGQGDVIGLGGSTGDATRKQLHFEIDGPDGPIDPLLFLPAVQASPPSNDIASARCPSSPLQIDPASDVNLGFTSVFLSDSQIVDAKVAASGSYYPAITVDVRGPLDVSLSVPPAPSASGQTIPFSLQLTFAKTGTQNTLVCPLTLTTRQTLPNPPPPTPTPQPTITPAAPADSAGEQPTDGGPAPAPAAPPELLPTETPTQIVPFTRTPTPKPVVTPKPGSPTPSTR